MKLDVFKDKVLKVQIQEEKMKVNFKEIKRKQEKLIK